MKTTKPAGSHFDYSIKAASSRSGSRARRGVLTTPHGAVQTPALVTVGTKATIKGLAPEDLEKTGTQFVFANTYHLTLSPTPELVQAHGGIHAMSGISKPMITDSGGFQVFSLASKQGALRNAGTNYGIDDSDDPAKPHLVNITEDGVRFRSHIDGTEYFFTPEFSIDAQQKIGADFMVALDECFFSGATQKYTKAATQRTHEWAARSLAQGKSTCSDDGPQRMYGVIQGGAFQELRAWSAQTIAEMNFFGLAIGGVAIGETLEAFREQVGWVMDEIHTDTRPRHLLGVSTFEEVLYGVQQGLDTFDCVLPARDARTGQLYIRTGEDERGIGMYTKIKIGNAQWKQSLELLNKAVLGNVTYAYAHHLFKQRELLFYRLGTMHNLAVMEGFFAEIRGAIEDGRL